MTSACTSAFSRAAGLAVVIVAALLSTGCATLTKGTSQTVTVTTDPAGATCRLTREGQMVAMVNPTPGSIPIDKSYKDVTVSCEKGGFHPSAGTLASSFQAMTFGNILFGGRDRRRIRCDARVSDARDDHADSRSVQVGNRARHVLRADESDVRDEIQGNARPHQAESGNETNCAAETQKAEAARTAKLAEIEAKRLQAKIGS